MLKKKILSAVIAASILCSAMPAFAYDQASYHAKADELKTLIAECQELGINTQYEEIDANIIEVYADRIAEFQADGLKSTISSFQLTELDTLYTNAKANLTAYKAGTKEAPAVVRTYEAGDNYKINGASLENIYGEPYFSAGFGHFGMSEHIPELSSYSFDNVQSVAALGDIVTGDRKIDSWDTSRNGNADVTYEMVTNYGRSNNTSFHVVNNSAKASNVYGSAFQRVPVKPESTYELSFYVKGEQAKHSTMYSVDDFDNKQWLGYNTTNYDTWTKETYTFTTGAEEYFKELRFFFEGICNLYFDDITIRRVGSDKNAVINGGFDGDGTDDFDIFYNASTSLHETLRTLGAGEKNNTHVEVLLQLQQGMPSIITAKYPEVTTGNGRYNIDHAAAQKVEMAYIKGVMAAVSEYDSLGSIIVANEPNYNSYLYSGYDTKFANFLENKYGTISALNSAYGKSYSSFAKVGIPKAYEASARFYDWKKFNEELFSNWYAKMVQTIKSCMPNIPVSVKVQPEFTANDSESTRKEVMIRGLDLVRLGELSDYQGNDSYGYYGQSGTTRATMLWYDFLDSIGEKPIYDSEKHITKDGSSEYNEDTTKFTKQMTWQSMVHGLDMFSFWTWETDVSDTSSARYGHLAMRPSALSEAAKAGLDANRLAEEVTALANAKPTVAILHDDTSRIYNNLYLGSVSLAYNAATEAGHKVGFVTPENIAANLSEYTTLVIPYATNVEASVINAIAGFGGKIIMLDSDSLKKNEYNQSYSGDMLTKVNQIKNKATVHEVSKSWLDSYKISSPSVSTVRSSFTNDSPVSVSASDDLEWQAVPYKNGYLVNVSNYSSSSKTVTIKLNGSTPSHITSAIDNVDVTSISLPKITSGLYYVRNVDDEMFEEEEVGPNEILRLEATRSGTTNTLTWKAENTGEYNIYNVTADGKLEFIGATKKESYTDTSDGPKTYAVKCVVEDGESEGKKITCGFDVSAAITVNATKIPSNKISINYTNNEAHSVAAEITATSYNEDGTFGSAAVIEVLVPAGKSFNYVKNLVGSGDIVITKN